jgi:ABC-type Fe3+-hydroxamate transport system substrate-binding protein
MKSVNIKGKEYITVNERLIFFRSQPQYKGWRISEEVVSLDEKEGLFKVTIINPDGFEMAVAHAQEYRDSSYINKTSFVENGFTSALGRALGYLGIGIDTAIASADEVQTAVNNQPKDDRSWLNETQLIATLKGTKEQAEKVVANYKMKKEYRTKINNQFNLK